MKTYRIKCAVFFVVISFIAKTVSCAAIGERDSESYEVGEIIQLAKQALLAISPSEKLLLTFKRLEGHEKSKDFSAPSTDPATDVTIRFRAWEENKNQTFFCIVTLRVPNSAGQFEMKQHNCTLGDERKVFDVKSSIHNDYLK